VDSKTFQKALKAAQAHAICALIHAGDYDKGGTPYRLHPEAVAAMSDDLTFKAVAYLHDTVEDHPDKISISFIRGFFDDKIADAVDAISRRGGEKYWDYIDRVKQCELAGQVKIADLKHNMRTDRLKDGGKGFDSLIKRYARALSILEE
jgi:(p)ppGpp synthase/HD superfamily hydrolase